MKVLNSNEVSAVSGGDYQLVVTMYVPTVVAQPTADLFEDVILGNVMGMGDFINELNNLGAQGNLIRLQTVTFQNFN